MNILIIFQKLLVKILTYKIAKPEHQQVSNPKILKQNIVSSKLMSDSGDWQQ